MAEQDTDDQRGIVETEEEATLSLEELEEALTTTATDEEDELPPPAAEPSDDIPDKYRGKTVKEVIAMHQEAEKALGRQSGEVGELRGIVDDFIQRQTTSVSTQQRPPEPEEKPDFYEDPEAAVSHAIAHHPDVITAREEAARAKLRSTAEALAKKHPDAQKIVSDPEFAKWIKASPVRIELFARADRMSDFEAADELLTSFKERAGVVQQTADREFQQRRETLRRASTGGAKGSQAAAGKPQYRRADIIRLMRDKPDRYAELAGDIQLAYEEGRVH